jgi:chemotaxis protein methyltransferase CheR
MALFPPSAPFSSATRPAASALSDKSAPRTPLFAPQSSLPAAKTPQASTVSPLTGMRTIRVSQEEFIQLRDFIYEKCGIHIAENRKYLIENRLSNRIKELNLKTFGEYYYFLRFDAGKQAELIKLFEVITTNETSFYRNPPQLQIFQDAVLKAELDKLRKAGSRKLRIWSAGCSTGEEPYTLAIILSEVLGMEIASWDIKISANDLSEAVLTAARKGVYGEYALRTTPAAIIARYFSKEGPDYRIDPKLKRLISFGHINLSDKLLVRRVERSQIIFCRNVIIYFDDEMKKQIIESFYDNLLPGGCLFIGHSESLHNISRAFKPEYHSGTIVYRKEA